MTPDRPPPPLQPAVQPPVPPAPEAVTMRRLLYGPLLAGALCTATELGLPELLHQRPRTAAGLADRVGASADSLDRLLRCLAAFGVVNATGDRYVLTSLGETLRPGVPGSALPTARLVQRVMAPVWHRLPDAVRSGKPAFPEVYGHGFFDHLALDPALREVFDRSQAAGLDLELPGVLAAVGESGGQTVVDLGGGDGALLAAVLAARPGARGVLADNDPTALGRARTALAAAGLGDRCAVRRLDLFTGELPAGPHTFLLRHILHDWGDDDCAALLRRIRAALAPGGRLLVVEHAAGASASSSEGTGVAALMDLYMLSLFPGGRERTQDRLRALLTAADLVPGEPAPLPTGSVVLTARPAGEGS
ncbi:methyltransferase [Streptomyces sp. NPDC003691]